MWDLIEFHRSSVVTVSKQGWSLGRRCTAGREGGLDGPGWTGGWPCMAHPSPSQGRQQGLGRVAVGAWRRDPSLSPWCLVACTIFLFPLALLAFFWLMNKK